MNCEHEMVERVPTDWFDFDDMRKYGNQGFHVKCKHCGCKGVCVKDEGEIWEDEEVLN